MGKQNYIFGAILLMSIMLVQFSSAVSFSLNNINSTYAQISIFNSSNVYAYEVNLDYTGSIQNVTHSYFLVRPGSGEHGWVGDVRDDGATNATANLTNGDSTYGWAYQSSDMPNVVSVYASRLDNTRSTVNGSGEMFNITHSGTVKLRYVLLIDNQGNENYIYMTQTSNLNLKIETNLQNHDGYAWDYYLKTNDGSVLGYDTYDFPAVPMLPNQSQFCSFVDGYCLAIDSFQGTALPRTVNLIYNITDSLTDNVIFNWSLQTGYEAILNDFGTDSNYGALVNYTDMKEHSSYQFALNGNKKTYFQIVIRLAPGYTIVPGAVPSNENLANETAKATAPEDNTCSPNSLTGWGNCIKQFFTDILPGALGDTFYIFILIVVIIVVLTTFGVRGILKRRKAKTQNSTKLPLAPPPMKTATKLILIILPLSIAAAIFITSNLSPAVCGTATLSAIVSCITGFINDLWPGVFSNTFWIFVLIIILIVTIIYYLFKGRKHAKK